MTTLSIIIRRQNRKTKIHSSKWSIVLARISPRNKWPFTLSVQSLRQFYLREAAERVLDFFLLSCKTYKPKAIRTNGRFSVLTLKNRNAHQNMPFSTVNQLFGCQDVKWALVLLKKSYLFTEKIFTVNSSAILTDSEVFRAQLLLDSIILLYRNIGQPRKTIYIYNSVTNYKRLVYCVEAICPSLAPKMASHFVRVLVLCKREIVIVIRDILKKILSWRSWRIRCQLVVERWFRFLFLVHLRPLGNK